MPHSAGRVAFVSSVTCRVDRCHTSVSCQDLWCRTTRGYRGAVSSTLYLSGIKGALGRHGAELLSSLARGRWAFLQCDPWALTGLQVANLLVWREMTGKAHEVERLYNAVWVVYATRNLSMPDSPLAREVVKGSRRIHAEEKRDIDRIEFPIAEFKKYCKLSEGRLRTRIRDRSLLALGLRCMRRPSELAKFKRRHVSWVAPSLAGWVPMHFAPLVS